MPSTMAVLPTPGSPIRTGLFLVLLERISMVVSTSSARPITGSSFPSLAMWVRSRLYSSNVGVELACPRLTTAVDPAHDYSPQLGMRYTEAQQKTPSLRVLVFGQSEQDVFGSDVR